MTHVGVSGTIRNIDDKVDFRPKSRLPIYKLRLGECEELLAVKAKARPCLVLATAEGIPDQHLPKGDQNEARPAFQRSSFLVAPAYSASTPDQSRATTATIAARAECLVHPQFVYLPKSGGYIKNESVVRLDRALWTTLAPPTELSKLSLTSERMGILHGQLQVLRGLAPDRITLSL